MIEQNNVRHDLVSVPGRGKDFFPHHPVQTGSGTHPLSFPQGTGGFFSGGKAAGA